MHHTNTSRQTRVSYNSIYQGATLQMHPPPLPRPMFYPNGGPSTDDVNAGPSTALVNRPPLSQKFNVQQRHQHPVTNSASSKINGPQKPSTIHKIRHIHPIQQVQGFNSQRNQSQNENISHTNTNNNSGINVSSKFISMNTKTTHQQQQQQQQPKIHIQQSSSSMCHNEQQKQEQQQKQCSLSSSSCSPQSQSHINHHPQLSNYPPGQNGQQSQQHLLLNVSSSYSHLSLCQQQQPSNHLQPIKMSHDSSLKSLQINRTVSSEKSYKQPEQQQQQQQQRKQQKQEEKQPKRLPYLKYKDVEKITNNAQQKSRKQHPLNNLQTFLSGHQQQHINFKKISNSQKNKNGVNSSSIVNTSSSNSNISSGKNCITEKDQLSTIQLNEKLSLENLGKNDDHNLSESGAVVVTENDHQNANGNDIGNDDIQIVKSSIPTNEMLKYTKDKTSMCLVNELARYNKIHHQYHLTEENGPAHSKRFTVTLKLGDEEYTADGPSIKKAQHSAAADAVCKTKYTHPPIKSSRLKFRRNGGIGNITPTVELNALAMKLGKQAIYIYDTVLPLPLSSSSSELSDHHYHSYTQNINSKKSHLRYQRFSKYNTVNQRTTTSYNTGMSNIASRTEMCKIILMVDEQKFTGIGDTPQAARHDAASRALEVLKNSVSSSSDESKDTNIKNINDDNDNSSIADIKSPISLVHEIALKRNLTVTFEVESEQGPAHIKSFVTICKVGDIISKGEGNAKKLAKKRAAENMLEELKKLPPLPSSSFSNKNDNLSNSNKNMMKRKMQNIKKRSKNIIKDNNYESSESNENINSISKLIQIVQASKEREPVYTLIAEKGLPRRKREFVMEVSAFGKTARGSGPNKKIAKQLAAKNLLILMGNDGDICTNEKNKSESIENDVELNKKQETVTALTTQPETTPAATSSKDLNQDKNMNSSKQKSKHQNKKKNSIKSKEQCRLSEDILNDNNDDNSIDNNNKTTKNSTEKPNTTKNTNQNNNNNSSSSNNNNNNNNNISRTIQGVRPKDQLLYLAEIVGFKVGFSNYPKGNHNEYLTIVTLSTDPPQICHGAGNDTDTSEDNAAMTALHILSNLGLDNIKSKRDE